jgi:hypothetical protein
MATTYLTRTPGSASNRQTWTVSIWFKRGNISGSNLPLLTADGAGDIETFIRFRDTNLLQISTWNGSGYDFDLRTNRLFRDTSAWYHVVVAADTTQGTASNRIKLYVNGVQETSFSTETYPSVDYNTYINTTVPQIIGSNGGSSYFDGSMAMMQLVDGQQLTPAYFGSTDSTTGIWTPTATSSISDYGTNGFKLAMDTTTPGADTSGKSNNFTASGTPTLTQGSPDNNWCTLNPLARRFSSSPNTFSNGNTTSTFPAVNNSWNPVSATFGMTKGKWYWESKSISGTATYNGIMAQEPTSNTGDVWLGGIANQFGYSGGNGYVYVANSNQASLSSYTNGDIVSVAYDADNNLIYFYKNGAIQNSGTGLAVPTPESTPLGAWFPAWSTWDQTTTVKSFNFGEGFFGTTAAGTQADDNGQGLFAYDVPAGYYALNTKNLEAYG